MPMALGDPAGQHVGVDPDTVNDHGEPDRPVPLVELDTHALAWAC